ncbi:hypothetical protein KCU87_g251, partial [Aureobasidium melanogenum]
MGARYHCLHDPDEAFSIQNPPIWSKPRTMANTKSIVPRPSRRLRGLRYSIEDPIRCYKCTLGNTSQQKVSKRSAALCSFRVKPRLAEKQRLCVPSFPTSSSGEHAVSVDRRKPPVWPFFAMALFSAHVTQARRDLLGQQCVNCSRKVKGDDAKEYPFCIGAEELLQGDPEALSLVPDYIL